jgi:hypothetical protein
MGDQVRGWKGFTGLREITESVVENIILSVQGINVRGQKARDSRGPADLQCVFGSSLEEIDDWV